MRDGKGARIGTGPPVVVAWRRKNRSEPGKRPPQGEADPVSRRREAGANQSSALKLSATPSLIPENQRAVTVLVLV